MLVSSRRISTIYCFELAVVLWEIAWICVQNVAAAIIGCTLTGGCADLPCGEARFGGASCGCHCGKDWCVKRWTVDNFIVAKVRIYIACIGRSCKNSKISCRIVVRSCGLCICVRQTILGGKLIGNTEESIVSSLSERINIVVCYHKTCFVLCKDLVRWAKTWINNITTAPSRCALTGCCAWSSDITTRATWAKGCGDCRNNFRVICWWHLKVFNILKL